MTQNRNIMTQNNLKTHQFIILPLQKIPVAIRRAVANQQRQQLLIRLLVLLLKLILLFQRKGSEEDQKRSKSNLLVLVVYQHLNKLFTKNGQKNR